MQNILTITHEIKGKKHLHGENYLEQTTHIS